MRALSSLVALAVFASPALAEDALQGGVLAFEENTYRYGDLYRSERGTTAEACAQMCTADRTCASWSLTPATFRIGPRCELKRTPGEAISRPGGASGMSEVWQMDPARHAAMRYQPSVPESRQPAAVPLDQLRPSPVPRTFGDPLPVREPELMGAPSAQKPVQTRTVAASSVSPPKQTQTIEVYRGPGQGVVPDYVKQPTQVEAPTPQAQPVRQTPKPVFKDPARKAPTAQPAVSNLNAVVRRQSQSPQAVATPAPQPAPAPAPTPLSEPAPQRVPWTERVGNTPNYSVGGSGYVPGDEAATAGFVEGLPEGEAGT
ncbi:MAG: hypothetical protein HRT80_03635 [Henriciella sp.]|nr:hypothetical protein [Henriciella sp.]